MNNSISSLNPEVLSSLTLAYIGDAVYELWVRCYLLSRGPQRVNDLHRETVKYVNAGTQSKFVQLLEPLLDEKEAMVLRKGRNAKSGRQPKKTEMIDYRRATGLEALVGYLYLLNKQERLEEIFSRLVELVEREAGKI
ncbi:MAG: Mini-ribonuclease 3 [Bacillota bacterium]|jgi:ribonuclease-3 family protein|nr:ribonuclease III [Clostridia bacterium]